MATPLTLAPRLRYSNLSKFLRSSITAVLLAMGSAGAQEVTVARTEAPLSANSAHSGAVLWSEPGDIAQRDLRFGEGGVEHSPRATVFAFDKEDLSGSNPKFIVTDPDGVKWKIKLGPEAKPEVAASRLVWAVGYFTNEDYFLPELQITGLPPKLHRGRQLIAPDGTVHEARLQRMNKKESKAGTWRWKDDPFKGSREWNGLRVMMALLNNWDLKDINNKIVAGKRRDMDTDAADEKYLVSDLGASLGTTGIVMGPGKSRGNLQAYSSSKFVTKVTPEYVDFATPSRATLLELFNLPQFWMRMRLRWIGKQVPREDAKWMAAILARLSPGQIRDAFRAAGYSPQEVEGFAQIVERRISILSDI